MQRITYKVLALITVVSIICYLYGGKKEMKTQYPEIDTSSASSSLNQHIADEKPSVEMALQAIDEVIALNQQLNRPDRVTEQETMKDSSDPAIASYEKAYNEKLVNLMKSKDEFQQLSQRYDEHILQSEGEPDFALLEEINQQQLELEEKILEQSEEMVEAYQIWHQTKVEAIRQQLVQLSQGAKI